MPLDGELWLARKAFQRTVSIIRRHDQSARWREVRFLVFDAPALAEPFEERVEQLRDLFGGRRPRYGELVVHERCQGAAHLDAQLARVEALGGEGLMLRQPASRYEAGRSTTLLKVKRFQGCRSPRAGTPAGERAPSRPAGSLARGTSGWHDLFGRQRA